MNSFSSRAILRVGKREFEIYRLDALEKHGCAVAAPALLAPHSAGEPAPPRRRQIGKGRRRARARLVDGQERSAEEIAFMPSRVLLQDFTGVPAVVDLAAMRDAMKALGGDPKLINPLQPAELVIDHSVQVDEFGTPQAFQTQCRTGVPAQQRALCVSALGTDRVQELRHRAARYRHRAPDQPGVPGARGVCRSEGRIGKPLAYPDTLVGTDSHTTMINGLGVLGWGVGGIEAEAAMLGQPVSMLIPQVVGLRLKGQLREGSTATDLVLTVTEMLRKKGVVGKFVEFFGPGLHDLPLADRATIANMAPEYGATCGIFPVDEETLRYLRLSGRSEEQVAWSRPISRSRACSTPPTRRRRSIPTCWNSILPRSSPALPDRSVRKTAWRCRRRRSHSSRHCPVCSSRVRRSRRSRKPRWEGEGGHPAGMDSQQDVVEEHVRSNKALNHGSVVIAAITSCTNTSNPSVLVAAGLLAKKAVEKGLIGTVVGEDFARAGIDGRHRLPHAIGIDAVSREAEVQPRRLRLHHVHRQLRPAAAGSLGRRSTRKTWWSRRCSAAIATSKAASTPKFAPTT